MKLRIWPIAMSLVVSSAVLFGGWFLYDSYAMETPLNQIVKETPGVKDASVQIEKDRVSLRLTLADNANLREIYKQVTEQGDSVIGKRKVAVEVANSSEAELDRWWSSALFDVAQAMETKKYGDIPVRLEARAAEVPGLTVSTEMDEQYVYVTLRNGTSGKYVMLPRNAAQLGVWPNE
ncbi:hypothetical protein [Paenibacillus koleovorans]|uniref:hypothetical protein n=1 Tax=Paenibacillus koleovorans TaxID=121608 RepID=UPI000FD6F882|nr:hypothetical protein [Paenibacillus koleovorans]